VLAVYVTGHGFGHSTRTAEVLRAVRELDPSLPIVVSTKAPLHLFEEAVAPPLRLRRLECDVGLVQRDALTIDEAATAVRWTEFARVLPERVNAEADFLRSARARVVLGDVPPLAFTAAAEAGVPSVALANFSWDWIYRHYASRHPALGEAAEACAKAYARCSRLLRLPFAGDLTAFPEIEDIPLVARRPRVSRIDARRRLSLPSGPLVLLSFGGLGLPGLGVEGLGGPSGPHFFWVGETPSASPPSALPDNVTFVPRARLAATHLGYEDVVGAADAVVTKPGYGIVSDAIGAGTAIVYTERGDFPEYPILVEGMKRYVPCAYVSNEDLLAGRLREPIDTVLRAPMPEPPPLDGAARAASRLLEIAAKA
jgi:L-arabinokinase